MTQEELNSLRVTSPDIPEREHFIPCPNCGKEIDCRKLGNVLYHEERCNP